jgi:hypothetical protein
VFPNIRPTNIDELEQQALASPVPEEFEMDFEQSMQIVLLVYLT